MVGCTLNKIENIDYKVTSIRLSIYGLNETPYEYYTKDKKIIDAIVNKINSILIKDNQVAKRNEVDFAKGISCELELGGEQSKELIFIDGYLVYDSFCYRVNNYQSIINFIKEKVKSDI